MATRSIGCAAVALIAVLAVALPASAQLSSKKAAEPPAPPAAIEIQAQPIPAFDHRDPSRQQFGMLDFRGGLVLTSPFREFGGISSISVAPDGANFIAAQRPGLVAARAHHLRRHAPDRHRRRRDGADARPRRAHAARARAGTTPRRSRRTAARSMSASSACTGSCASISARTACWRAAQPIEVPAAFRVASRTTAASRRWCSCRAARPARRHADRDLRARARPRRRSPRVPDRRAAARHVHDQAHGTITTSATPTLLPGGDLVVLERKFGWTTGLFIRIRRIRSRRSRPARWSTGRCCSRPISASRSTIWKGISVHRARRRDRADADLGQQFLGAAAHAAAAVHAGGAVSDVARR